MPFSTEAFHRLIGSLHGLRITADISLGATLGNIDVDAFDERYQDEPDDRAPDGITPDDLTDVTFAEQLTAEVLRWHAETSPPARGAMAVFGLCNAAITMREFLWNITGPLAEEYLYRRGWPLPKDILGNDVPLRPLDASIPTIQSLRLPYLVTARLAGDPSLRRMIGLLRSQYARTVAALRDTSPSDIVAWLEDNLVYEPQPVERRTAAQQRRHYQTRKALRRSVQALNRFVAPDAYQAFISPQGLLIEGCLYDYRVCKTLSLMEFTETPSEHIIPYRLRLFNKQGDALANGCVVFADTPVLDQIVALALHVRDAEAEQDLLRKANFLKPTQAGWDDPVLGPLLLISARGDTDLHHEIALAALQGMAGDRFFSRRKWIMDCIEANVVATLSRMTGIPLPIYRYMSQRPVSLFIARAWAPLMDEIMTLFRQADDQGPVL